MIPSLSEKYAIDALKYILEKGRIKKTDLLEIITSSWTLDKLIPKLERDGLLEVKESTMGRRTYEISLTPKGRVVAENLMHLEDHRVSIPEGLVAEIEKIIERDKSHSSVEEYVREAVRKAIEKWKKEHAVG